MPCRSTISIHALRAAGGLLLLIGLVATSCQTQPYAPPPRLAEVESVEVTVSEFHGRPDAVATLRGTLSSPAAQLVDVKQSREGERLLLEVLEQTPRGAPLLPVEGAATTAYERRVPLELLGLPPGDYLVVANGVEAAMSLAPPRAAPAIDATLASGAAGTPVGTPISPSITLVDEFIPIEEIGGVP